MFRISRKGKEIRSMFELTHNEEINLVIQIMLGQPERDLEAGRKWQRSQQRTIRIVSDLFPDQGIGSNGREFTR